MQVSSAVGMQLAPAMESLLRTLGEVQSEEKSKKSEVQKKIEETRWKSLTLLL